MDSDLPRELCVLGHVTGLMLHPFNFWVKNGIQQNFPERTELLGPFLVQSGEVRLQT